MKYLYFFTVPCLLTVRSLFWVGTASTPRVWTWWDSVLVFVWLVGLSWAGWLAAMEHVNAKLRGYAASWMLTPTAVDAIQNLQKRLNLPDEKAVLAKAMALLQTIEEWQREGATVQVVTLGGQTTKLPALNQ